MNHATYIILQNMHYMRFGLGMKIHVQSRSFCGLIECDLANFAHTCIAGIPVTKKKFAELELSLLHLQQNVEIPETHLIIHPTIQKAVEHVRNELEARD